MSCTQVNKLSNSTQGKNCNNLCKKFAKCKCSICKSQSFCNNGCNTCKRNHTCYAINYCSNYNLSINRAKSVVSDIKLKNMLLADKHSDEYNMAVNEFINNMINE